jgi:hypothetical protein
MINNWMVRAGCGGIYSEDFEYKTSTTLAKLIVA